MNFIEKETMEHDRDADETELPLFLQGEVSPLLKSGAKLPPYIKDHRKRLRQRFMQGGATAIPDYELLELVLFRAIPRRDVKPLARALLDQFGDFNCVLSAPFDRLKSVPGVSLAVIQELKLPPIVWPRLKLWASRFYHAGMRFLPIVKQRWPLGLLRNFGCFF